MTFSIDELTKKVSVDIPSDLKARERKELLEEIGEYIKITMLDMIGDGRSPVTGQEWKQLSKDYAKIKGSKEANMDLNGDMLDALDYEVTKGELYVGWFDSKQAVKAYGHTTGMKDHPFLDGVAPKRKLLPNDKEKFTAEIRSGVEDIVREFLDAREG
jgi:hypothetical protein